MSNIINLSKLSFFKVSKYIHENSNVCDFSDVPRPHYCMGLVYEGKGDFVFDDKKVTVTAGDIIFVPVGSTYISTWTGTPDILYVSAHFSFDFHKLFPRSKKVEIQKVTLSDFEKQKELFTQMYEDSENNKATQFSALSTFFGILSRVYPLIKYSDTMDIDSRIEKAIDYIELHHKEKIQIESLAKLCNMSSSHFHTCFKECTGCSPIEYKQRISIRNAELMLVADSNKSIEEISEDAGFTSSIYFRELFKKITGKTPSQYRRHSKSEEFSNI